MLVSNGTSGRTGRWFHPERRTRIKNPAREVTSAKPCLLLISVYSRLWFKKVPIQLIVIGTFEVPNQPWVNHGSAMAVVEIAKRRFSNHQVDSHLKHCLSASKNSQVGLYWKWHHLDISEPLGVVECGTWQPQQKVSPFQFTPWGWAGGFCRGSRVVIKSVFLQIGINSLCRGVPGSSN